MSLQEWSAEVSREYLQDYPAYYLAGTPRLSVKLRQDRLFLSDGQFHVPFEWSREFECNSLIGVAVLNRIRCIARIKDVDSVYKLNWRTNRAGHNDLVVPPKFGPDKRLLLCV